MINLTALFILLASAMGMAIIIVKKIPVLAEMPVREKQEESALIKIKNKINARASKIPQKEVMLQRVLSKVRIMTLKTENKTSSWLEKLHQKSLDKKKNFSDNYWEKIRKK